MREMGVMNIPYSVNSITGYKEFLVILNQERFSEEYFTAVQIQLSVWFKVILWVLSKETFFSALEALNPECLDIKRTVEHDQDAQSTIK